MTPGSGKLKSPEGISSLPPERGVWFATDHMCEASSTSKGLPLHVASQAINHIEIGFGRRNGNSPYCRGGIDKEIQIFDHVELWKEIGVPNVLCVNFALISVTKFWDMIIHDCMCKGRTHHSHIVTAKSHYKTTNQPVFISPVAVKCESNN
jgi:hypothetical protein